MQSRSAVDVSIHRYLRTEKNFEWVEPCEDLLSIEEPLEIRLAKQCDPDGHRCLSVTMRTPGDDLALTLGFLWTEGVISKPEDLNRVFSCGTSGNVVRAELSDECQFSWQSLQRHFYTTSSCGICGKTSIEALRTKSPFTFLPELRVHSNLIFALPEKMHSTQIDFAQTGSLHAAALFSKSGKLICVKEDVGRHNALDKLIGSAVQNKTLPLDQHLLVLSGRASFELIQKSYMAGIQVVVAVGAPSSLAVELAKEMNITLIGFTKDKRFNLYSHPHRIGVKK